MTIAQSVVERSPILPITDIPQMPSLSGHDDTRTGRIPVAIDQLLRHQRKTKVRGPKVRGANGVEVPRVHSHAVFSDMAKDERLA